MKEAAAFSAGNAAALIQFTLYNFNYRNGAALLRLDCTVLHLRREILRRGIRLTVGTRLKYLGTNIHALSAGDASFHINQNRHRIPPLR